MRGDVANLSRVMLMRLSIAAAAIAAVAVFMYAAGSVAIFSDEALIIAIRTAAAAGFVAAFAAPVSGARFSPVTIILSLLAGVIGLSALALAAVVLAVSGGLAP